eukprot:gene7344-11662_t
MSKPQCLTTEQKIIVCYCIKPFSDSIEQNEDKLHKLCKNYLEKVETILYETLEKTKITIEEQPLPIILAEFGSNYNISNDYSDGKRYIGFFIRDTKLIDAMQKEDSNLEVFVVDADIKAAHIMHQGSLYNRNDSWMILHEYILSLGKPCTGKIAYEIYYVNEKYESEEEHHLTELCMTLE